MARTLPYSNTKTIGKDESYTDINPGPYVATVKDNVDPTRMGRLRVQIPQIGSNNPGDPFDSELITVEYAPPFYGTKSGDAINTTDITNYANTQHSYGMWAVPPDIDSKVLVIFAEGKITNGYWIACVQEPFVNNMTPGIASSKDTYAPLVGDTDSNSVVGEYGNDNVPAGEVNRGVWSTASVGGFDKLKKPIHPFAERLKNQGLIKDDVRGNTSSSARRETPSHVFGISTPGPVDKRSSKRDKLGPKDKKTNVNTTRKTGHTFVMDDGDSEGKNQLVRLRTGSGHQLLMSDSAGVVYLANSDGTVWMEFSNNGMVDVYAQTGYNLRSGADINFHAEGNINMYANKSVKIKANEESGTVSIDGSNILEFASENLISQGNNVYSKATKNIIADAGDRNIQQGSTRVDLIGGQVHFNSYGVISNLVTSLQRTSFTQPTGTGTALTSYPDVTLKPLGQVYEVDRALPGMSGMRVPTHEPFWGHQDNAPAFGSVGGDNTNIGTPGHIENLNRNADLMSIRWAQYKADLDAELNKNPNSTENSVASLFNATKSNDFLIGVENYATLGTASFETYNKLTSSYKTGNSDNITNVLVNESNVLYTVGANTLIKTTGADKVVGNLSKTQSTVQNVGTLLTKGTSITNNGIVPGLSNVASLNNLNNVTTTYKNVVGGKVTSVVQTAETISTVAKTISTVGKVARSIGKYFGF
tara:strand:- start:19070 stop:21175 length:2106 start_codon:yes stop_codon:yes gene_type:complete